MARSEMTGYLFLVLSQKQKFGFENSSCKLLSFNYPAFILGMAGVVSWNFNFVWFADPTFSKSDSKVLLKLCVKLLTSI